MRIAAALLGLAGFIRHRIWLAGLVALLRLIRLVLLCHNTRSSISRRFFVRVQRVLIPHSTPTSDGRLPIDSMEVVNAYVR